MGNMAKEAFAFLSSSRGILSLLTEMHICGDSDIPRSWLITGSGLCDEDALDSILIPDWRKHEYGWDRFGIDVPVKDGHPGTFVLSYLKNGLIPILVSRGRVHLNQVLHREQMLRLWLGVGFLLMGGGRYVISTQAVGGYGTEIEVGKIAIPTQLIGYHWPSSGYINVSTDGHPATESVFPHRESYVYRTLCASARYSGLDVCRKGLDLRYIPVVGPCFGGVAERDLFGNNCKCHTVGMSGKPEADGVAVENMTGNTDHPLTFVPIQVVSDNQDIPSDSEVVAEVRKKAPQVLQMVSFFLSEMEGNV
ncbi:MAG: hypothetical protein COV07_00895 [Candidatus Vogelbacteria bacterium CG10_big_fil_rev_8_21_14_0_10_45_14]|uniref:Nucleoside phosphorylase domain-containing protein n=1 Tax=Candidatus Vogelbacteria bacterium CG10_big_fil_rev_8_21_14_0_10_45_14 TaxID=1975042 RepID=A0A2H0RKK9_9BACT|nr:MAG: hypothetical protein COV07_00895 [Candidatus Vogelbacteria bacterium CG10_big_fil_rev_8_21_14_0_10_45_14]